MSRSKCVICQVKPRDWILQWDLSPGVFCWTLPGHHYRGFPAAPVCDDYKYKLDHRDDDERWIFRYQGKRYWFPTLTEVEPTPPGEPPF